MIKTKEEICKEIDLGVALAQLEGSIDFLNYMAQEKSEAPRTLTEKMTIEGMLDRIKELRKLYNQIKK